MELNGEFEFKNLLNSYYNGWPLIDNKFNPSERILDRIIKYERMGSNPLFGFGVSQSIHDPKSSTLFVKNLSSTLF
jgi:hypothetical protein